MNLSPEHQYQFKPFIGSSHSWAIDHAKALPKDSSILDIGTGSGCIGKALKDAGFNNLFGIEINQSAREHVQDIYQRVEPNIEPFREKQFDLILLLDVLEHLTDPEVFLSDVLRLAKPGATILVSVPNIAHWSVRFLLLFGSFTYTSRGILDKTHFSHFTRTRLKNLIAKHQGLVPIDWNASIEPIEFILPKLFWNNSIFRAISKFRQSVAKALPGLFAFQHLVAFKTSIQTHLHS